jgi:hypothetical protein
MRRYGVIGACQARNRVRQDHEVAAVFDQPLGLLNDHLGDLDVAHRGLVEGL